MVAIIVLLFWRIGVRVWVVMMVVRRRRGVKIHALCAAGKGRVERREDGRVKARAGHEDAGLGGRLGGAGPNTGTDAMARFEVLYPARTGFEFFI